MAKYLWEMVCDSEEDLGMYTYSIQKNIRSLNVLSVKFLVGFAKIESKHKAMTIQKLRWLQILTDGMLGKSHVGGLGKETDPVRVELSCAARNIKMAMTVMFLRSSAFISVFSYLGGFDTPEEFGLIAPFLEVILQPYPPPPHARLKSMKRKHSNMDLEMSILEEIEFDAFLLTTRRRLEIVQGVGYPPMPKKHSIIYTLPCGRVELENLF